VLLCGCSLARKLFLVNQTNEQVKVVSDNKTLVSAVGASARIYSSHFSIERRGCQYSYELPTMLQIQQAFSSALTQGGFSRDLEKLVFRLKENGEIDVVQVNDVVVEAHAQSTGIARGLFPLSPKDATCQKR
jgi:hypothetical protein